MGGARGTFSASPCPLRLLPSSTQHQAVFFMVAFLLDCYVLSTAAEHTALCSHAQAARLDRDKGSP